MNSRIKASFYSAVTSALLMFIFFYVLQAGSIGLSLIMGLIAGIFSWVLSFILLLPLQPAFYALPKLLSLLIFIFLGFLISCLIFLSIPQIAPHFGKVTFGQVFPHSINGAASAASAWYCLFQTSRNKYNLGR